MAHVPNVLIFEDFENLAMLLNYVELALVLTPARYNSPSPVSFQQAMYKLPRSCGRIIRHWLVNNFEMILDPPVSDGYEDETRLEGLMLTSLVGQAHTLWDSVKRRDELGVDGPTCLKGGREMEINQSQVLDAIQRDLSSFPHFKRSWPKELRQPVPKSYCWPVAPASSCYKLRLKSQ
jgi:hypothetical protein